MQRDSRGMRAETVQIESINTAARGLANARFEFCMNSGRFINQGQDPHKFCTAYAYSPESLSSNTQRGLVNVSRKSMSTVSAKGSVPEVQQSAFSQNPRALQRAMLGRVQRTM